MVLDAALVNTQHYKVRIKDKVEQVVVVVVEESSARTQHLSVVVIERGGFGSPSTKVSNLYQIFLSNTNNFQTDLWFSNRYYYSRSEWSWE